MTAAGSGTVPAGGEPAEAPEDGVSRWLALMLLGTVLFVSHVVLALRNTAGPGTLWVTGIAGLALIFVGCVAVGRAFRSERRYGRALAAARAQLQALIDASPLAITAGNREGRITLWSAAAEGILGWSADEVLGKPYPAVPEERVEEWRGLRRRVLAGETVHGLETRRRTRDGQVIDVAVSAAPVRDSDGEITGTLALVEDLRQSRVTAREVEKLETQLRQAQKMEVVGRLAAGIAHDFNNFLTAIRGNAELILAADGLPAELEADLQEIARSAERAAALTRRLLTFTYREKAEKKPLDLNMLLDGMRALMRRLVDKTIELRVELAEDTGTVLIDPQQVEQVLMNLVVNARDALPDGGRIAIRTRGVEVGPDEAESLPYEVRPGPYALISVTDNGVGMSVETAERIFEPFFTTKPVGVGTGLGLSTVYGIVKQARGHIRVDTEPGSGTTFRIYLPSHEAERAGTRQDEPAAALTHAGSETILVVEDEEAVLSMARRTLERQGYEVLVALSGRDAVRLARQHPGEIHILFCDMVMPDLTGRTIAERVTAARPDIQVLLTSGYGEQRLTEEAAPAGAAFLPKPYTAAELTALIRQLLGQPTRG